MVHSMYLRNVTQRKKTVTILGPNSVGSGSEIIFGFVQMLPDSLAYLLPRQSTHGGKMFVPIRMRNDSWCTSQELRSH
jgi:hypothetical protein